MRSGFSSGCELFTQASSLYGSRLLQKREKLRYPTALRHVVRASARSRGAEDRRRQPLHYREPQPRAPRAS